MKKLIFGLLFVLMLFVFVGCGQQEEFTCTQCQGSGDCTSCFGTGEGYDGGGDCHSCNGSGKCYKCMGTGTYSN